MGQITELGTNWATVSTLIDVDMSVGLEAGGHHHALGFQNALLQLEDHTDAGAGKEIHRFHVQDDDADVLGQNLIHHSLEVRSGHAVKASEGSYDHAALFPGGDVDLDLGAGNVEAVLGGLHFGHFLFLDRRQIFVSLLHVFEDLLLGHGPDDLQHPGHLGLGLGDHHHSAVLQNAFLQLEDHPDAGAGEEVHFLHVEDYGLDVFLQKLVHGFFKFGSRYAVKTPFGAYDVAAALAGRDTNCECHNILLKKL